MNSQFAKDILTVPSVYEKLGIVSINGEDILKGELDIIDDTGNRWEAYHIEIWGTNEYPLRFPKLFETNNAFPKVPDWHVNPSDHSCCVDVTPSELLTCRNGYHILDYIKNFAIPYLANQKFRELEGYYKNGEYAHNFLGHIQFYQNKLNAKDLHDLIGMIDLIVSDFNPGRTAECPFCDGKFRKCHRDSFNELRAIKSFLIPELQYLRRIYTIDPGFNLT